MYICKIAPATMYLLEETQEAREMREKVLNLLHSHDVENHHLAYQLIVAGGVHADFISHTFFLALYTYWESAKHTKRYSFRTSRYSVTPPSLYWEFLDEFVGKEAMEKFKKSMTLFKDRVGFLNYLSRNETSVIAPYWREVFKLLFYKTTMAGEICYKHEVLSMQAILARLEEENIVDLQLYKLEDLPDELATLKHTRLRLLECPLTNITRKKWINWNIEEIEFNLDISQKAKRTLAQCFPSAFRKKYDGGGFLALVFLKTLPAQMRDEKFYRLCIEQYKNQKKYKMATKCYQKIAQMYDVPS